MTEYRRDNQQGLGGMAKATEALGGMMGTMKAGLGAHSESAFVANACRGDMYEIEAGRIAERRARSPEIRQLAQRMIEDHTNSSTRLLAALRAEGASEFAKDLPDSLDQHRETMIDHLNRASDDEFDGVYLTQQKMAHRETMTLFEGFASSGDNPQLVAYAREMLPMLHQHKELVDRIEGSGNLRS